MNTMPKGPWFRMSTSRSYMVKLEKAAFRSTHWHPLAKMERYPYDLSNGDLNSTTDGFMDVSHSTPVGHQPYNLSL